MLSLLGKLFNFFRFKFPGLKNSQNVLMHVSHKFLVINFNDRLDRYNFKYLISEISAQGFNKFKLSSSRVKLILIPHLSYLLKKLNEYLINLHQVICR
jgi:hypothetical protein